MWPLRMLYAERESPIHVHLYGSSNNLDEDDHCTIKRRDRPTVGFNDFRCTTSFLAASKPCTWSANVR